MTDYNQHDPFTPLEDLPEDVQQVAMEAQRLRQANANNIGFIEKNGGGIEIASARTEHLVASLVHMGVITVDQMWQINRDWERSLFVQVKESRRSLEAMIEARRQEAAKPKLYIPGKGNPKGLQN